MKHPTLLVILILAAVITGACSAGGAAPASPAAGSTRTQQATTPVPTATATIPLQAQPSPTPGGAASPAAPTVTPAGSSVTLVSVDQIKSSPDQLRDRLVKVRGVGISVATMPLCPGYVGFDKRVVFFESAAGGPSIYAVNKLPAGTRAHYDTPQVFEAYVRVFSGDTGCPGQIKHESFPYLEVVGVVPGSAGAGPAPSPVAPNLAVRNAATPGPTARQTLP